MYVIKDDVTGWYYSKRYWTFLKDQVSKYDTIEDANRALIAMVIGNPSMCTILPIEEANTLK